MKASTGSSINDSRGSVVGVVVSVLIPMGGKCDTEVQGQPTVIRDCAIEQKIDITISDTRTSRVCTTESAFLVTSWLYNERSSIVVAAVLAVAVATIIVSPSWF